MLKIFVDTCVWRYWLSFHSENLQTATTYYREAAAFERIFRALVSRKLEAELLYDERVLLELGTERAAQVISTTVGFARRVPIPRTRLDGSCKLDGSFMFGGSFGVSLSMLTSDGLDHERLIHEAALRSRAAGSLFYNEKIRIKEFDVEHLEASLEAGADYFITTDSKTIIQPLKRLRLRFEQSEALARVSESLRLPSDLARELSLPAE
jgi:hypothetical protein